MPHFLIEKNNIKDNYIEIFSSKNDDNFFHITKARRAKIGEEIKFIDEDKIVYNCKIEEITKNSLKAIIISNQISKRTLKYELCLIQSILAPDAQNLLIANATQTGVNKIYPVISDNVATKKQIKDYKIQKWEKIALENFKQCERADMVKINEISELKEVFNNFKKDNILIFAEKDENISLDESVKNVDKSSPIAIVIGPEGGFSDNEFKYFKENNFKLISLGLMIYKAPNATVAAISNISSRL